MKRAIALLALAASLAACSQSHQAASQPGGEAASPNAQPSNPLDFPLFAQSTVLTTKPWHQSGGSQNYSGVEIIAQTPATMAQLGDWIHGLSSTPPAGYTISASGSGVDEARTRARNAGVDFQVFQHTVGGKTHALIVMAIDPQTFDAKAGPLISAIGKYKMLPQSLRDPIDAQVKQRTGYTVSDALNPDTPIGAAIAAVDTLRSSGERGVVLVDGTKE